MNNPFDKLINWRSGKKLNQEQENQKWEELENMAEGSDFTSHEGDRNVWSEEDPDDGLEYFEWRKSPFEDMIDTLEDEKQDLPFEEQDILGDALKKGIAEKRQTAQRAEHQKNLDKTAFNNAPLYTFDDFKLMKEAVVFNDLAKYRPMFANRTPMTDEQIIEKVATLMEMQDGRGPERKISPDERRLMEHCKNWYDIASQKSDYKEMPRRADGKLFSQQEIDELDYDYRDLRKNEPLEFAKCELELFGESKVEKGEWEKAQFCFIENIHKERTQWIYDKDEMHDGKIVHVRYISRNDPSLVAKPGTVGTFYYTVQDEMVHPHNKSLKTVFIDLKLPFVKEQKNKPARKEILEQEKMAA